MEKTIVIKVGREFVGEDYHSGGYPYLTSLIKVKPFETTTDAWEWLGSCRDWYPEARLVYRVITIQEISE